MAQVVKLLNGGPIVSLGRDKHCTSAAKRYFISETPRWIKSSRSDFDPPW